MMKAHAIGFRGLLLESKGMVSNLSRIDALSDDNLLAIFRIATFSRFVISAILFAVVPIVAEEPSLGRLVNALEALLLGVYLSLTPLQRLFKASYMPLALVWASVIPLFVSSLTIYLRFATLLTLQLPVSTQQAETFVVLSNVALNLPTLLIPLLIVSWRYSQKVVIWFCLGTSILDIAVLAVFVPVGRTNLIVAFSLILFRLIILSLVGLVVNHLITVQRSQAKALRDANTRLRDYAATREHLITSQERNRLARELHDTLAHTLAAATVQLEAVQVIWETQPERAKQLVQESTVTMRGGLQDTRRALQALRAETLESIGFVASIQLLAESIQARYRINTSVETADDVLWLTQEQEHVVYRVAQEALLNSAQHAQAQHIRIKIEETGETLCLIVIDDGAGFDPSTVDANTHFGVQGMRERARMIGAELDVSSQVGQGTQLRMKLKRKSDAYPNL
jgi:signal transduction histidine kinase